MVRIVASTILIFFTSSVDDFVLLACIFAGRRIKFRELVLSKMLCTLLALSMSFVIAAAARNALPLAMSRVVGVIALGMGIKRLGDGRRPRMGSDAETFGVHWSRATVGGTRRVLNSMPVLFAASVDNIALYIPQFSHSDKISTALTMGIVLLLTVLLCGAAFLCGSIRSPFRSASPKVGAAVPYLMIYIGVTELVNSV